MVNLRDTIKHSWDMFTRHTKERPYSDVNPQIKMRVDEPRGLSPKQQSPFRQHAISSTAATIFTRIAMDVSMVEFQHVKIDPETETQSILSKSSLNRLFTVEANSDQTSVDFFHELVYNMFDDGEVVVVPTVTDVNPLDLTYNIIEVRIGKTIERYRDKIKVRLYNPEKGDFSEVVVPKKMVAIIQNPLYAVLSNGNPTLERLLRKLSIVDKEDMDNITNRANMILQLPIPVKGSLQRSEAEERIKDLEEQLKTNKLGVAYIGANEKVTQLGKTLQSNLMDDIKYLKGELMSELGLNENVFNGTASAADMQHYNVRTIQVICKHIQQEFQRKFLTKTAYTQGQRVNVYMDPFKLIDISILASTGDSLIRNGILTANEFRNKIGFGPHWAPQADTLFNPNIANKNQQGGYGYAGDPGSGGSMDPNMMGEEGYEDQNEGEYYE